ncbi:hypothetical protein EDD66_11566 [Mobilisporobacter senegalensis]|uniref:Uncharacterized protein n=1 Tax=Mobilisporobacter senegalensis TaxID=1329262 RepID=A0A3N1X8K4_9FIRM|nr:hypothetical protein [Mobilisporobacter senegalensis]ROR22381.1 hypothetical protein EDD66_11566 [Mobilisporobacter senegalensis]
MDNNNFDQTTFEPNNGQQLEAPLTLGEWILTIIILGIPCVNIVMMFIWGFGKTGNISRRNYCRAMLIFAAIGIVLGLLFSSVIGAMIASMSSGYGYY